MPFYDSFTELRQDTWGGRGLFATRKIPKGEIVVPDSFGDWSEGEEEGWKVLHLSDLNNFPSEKRELILTYSLCTDLEGHILTPLEKRYLISAANFINHSCNGNLWIAEDSAALIARRDIEDGEELTLDYAVITYGFERPFECRCNSANCRGKVRGDDWRLIAPEYGAHLHAFMRPLVNNAKS
jgi:SET domain-containing protein